MSLEHKPLTISNESSKQVVTKQCGAVPAGLIEPPLAVNDGRTGTFGQAIGDGRLITAQSSLRLVIHMVSHEGSTVGTGLVNTEHSFPTSSDSYTPDREGERGGRGEAKKRVNFGGLAPLDEACSMQGVKRCSQ